MTDDWNLEALGSFWRQIEQEEAMREKARLFYDLDLADSYEPENDEDECYYGFECCIDSGCRDIESCLGCELLYGEEDA